MDEHKQFTDEEIKALRELVLVAKPVKDMLVEYQMAGRIWRLLWKTLATLGGAVAFVATTKDHFMKLIK